MKWFWTWLCLTTGLLAAPASEDSLIQKINQWELEALKSETPLLAIEKLFDATSREEQPRVWLHAFTFLPEARRANLALSWDEMKRIAEAQNDPSLLIRIWLFRLKQQVNQGATPEELQKTFAAGDAVCQTWSDPVWCGRWKQALGWQHHVLDDLATGLKETEKALDLMVQAPTEYAYFLHEAEVSLAIMLQEAGQSERAMTLSKSNFQWYSAQGYLSEAAYTAYNLAYHMMESKNSDYVSIRQYLNDAEKLARKVNNQDCLGLVLYARGNLATKLGQTKTAIQDFTHAFAIFRTLNNWEFAGLNSIDRARTHVDLRELANARQALDEARKILPKDYKFAKLRILDVSHQIAKQDGNMPLAHQLLEQYLQASNEQNAEQEKKQLHRLSVQLGLQVEEQRNRVLQQENALQAHKLHEAEAFRIFVICLGALALCTVSLLIFALRQTATIRLSQLKMKRILDHIDEGLFTIDRSLSIGGDYSKRLPEILGVDGAMDGHNFIQTTFDRSQMPGESRAMIQDVMQAVLGEARIAWELNEGNLPGEIVLGVEQEKIVAIRWIPVFDADDILQHVLVSLRDVTQARSLEQAYGSQQRHLKNLPQTFQEMLDIKPERMQNILKESRELLQRIDSGEGVKALLRSLHTLKGNARTLGLRSFSQDFHELESLLQHHAGQDHLSWPLQEQLERTRERVVEYEALADVLQRRSENAGPSHAAWLAHVVDTQIAAWKKMAADAGLSLMSLQVQDDILDWADDDLLWLEQLILHAVTNSLDHGFILPRASGRTVALPRLMLHAERVNAWISVKVIDNGAGIDLKKIQALAQKHGFVPEVGRGFEDVLFLDGASTADHVTLTSGRGVGLAAIKALVEQRGGRVHIRNRETESGTILHLEWPCDIPLS